MMKKYNFKYLFLFLGLILIFSCQDDSISSESLEKKNKIFINKDETVDVSIFKYGSKTFRLNSKEKSFIDLNDNNLKVPIIIEDKKTKNSNLSNSLQPSGVCIVIARKKPPRKPGKSGNCECGLGFRCRVFSCDDDGNPTITENSNSFSKPIQRFIVTLSNDETMLIFTPDDEIDWNSYEK